MAMATQLVSVAVVVLVVPEKCQVYDVQPHQLQRSNSQHRDDNLGCHSAQLSHLFCSANTGWAIVYLMNQNILAGELLMVAEKKRPAKAPPQTLIKCAEGLGLERHKL